MWRVFSSVLAMIAAAAASPLADECGPPEPIQVSAVCGQTLLMVGWKSMPEGQPYSYAQVFSRQRVQLWRDERKIAETTSDNDGKFAFPPLAKGSYELTVPYTEYVGINTTVIVTENRARRCETPLFLYLGDKGYPCRGHASSLKPLQLSADTIHEKQ